MAFMTWDTHFVTGNSEIDGQHQKLVNLINQLHEAMRTGKGGNALSGIFDELLAYTDYHFKTEEKLFDSIDYQEKDKHKKEHQELVKQALALQVKFQSGATLVTIEVLKFLKNWVSDHILKMDMTYKGII